MIPALIKKRTLALEWSTYRGENFDPTLFGYQVSLEGLQEFVETSESVDQRSMKSKVANLVKTISRTQRVAERQVRADLERLARRLTSNVKKLL